MGIKTYQKKNTRPMEKDLAQSDLPVGRKIQKPPENLIFLKTEFLGGFWDCKTIFAIFSAF